MFTDQCKRRGIKIEDLDKGWVPQHKIGEEPEDEVVEDIEEDVDEDDDDEIDEDALFSKSDSSDKESKSEESKESKQEVNVEKPEMSLADLEAMFGPSTTSIEETPSSSEPAPAKSAASMYGDTPNRDRIGNALKQADVNGASPSVTFDKTSADPGAAASLNAKPKIKLNIKPKQ